MTARRTVLSVLLALALGPPAARADEPSGAPCSLVTTGADEGVLTGGPVAGTGTLTCAVQVGVGTHDGPDAVSASAAGTGVVVLEPREVSFPVPYDWDDLYVCTTFTPAGGAPRYWSRGQWTSDSAAGCAVDHPGVRHVGYLLGAWCDVDLCPWSAVDCASMASLSPGVPGVVDVDQDGDVYVDGELLWDCPPYGS